MAAAAPTGTVTFLFTDIEGSTQMWEEHGDAMAAALARHDEIAKSVFADHGGYVFATGGDGFAVAFPRAADGMSAASNAQRALAAEEWEGAVIKVRMGLHVGEAEERDGDYFGPAVNRAARIMAAGHGGQILATEACAQVVGADSMADLGEFRLRDLSGPQRVFQIGEGSFPRLRTIDAYPSNLPQNLSSFVGRGDQVAQLLDDLRACDLVTLTGTGGVGKTRLAVQVCAEALPKFGDGAWFVDLAAIRDPDQIVVAAAEVLNVKERAGEALEVTLRDYLRDREAIVLFDNGEHVVDALAGLIEQLWSREISAKFLITTREPLGIDGEKVRRVASLDDQESADLFVQRAASARDEIDWSAYTHEVAEICVRLDGIPLAIELAAARCRSMLPPDILSRLDERFRILSGGKRTARERHQTLLAAVEWSYELLDESERQLFDRLALFRGGFSLEAAEAVCSGGAVEDFDVVDLLDRLVDKSMVLAFQSDERSRYRLLETLRQFGESRLAESGTGEEYRDRHVNYMQDFIRERMAIEDPAERARNMAVVHAEFANTEAALGWLADNGSWSRFWQLCRDWVAIWTAMSSREALVWFGLLLEHLDRLEPEDQVDALAAASHLVQAGEDSVAARQLAERSIAMAQEVGCAPPVLAYLTLAYAAADDGDDEASARFALLGEEAPPWQETDSFPWACQMVRASSYVELRRPEAAAFLAELAATPLVSSMPIASGGVLLLEGRLASLDGDHHSAEQLLMKAVDQSRGRFPRLVTHGLGHRAEGRLRASHDYILEGISEALDVFAEGAQNPKMIAEIWAIIATVWLRDGRVDDAAVLGSASGALLTSLGIRGRRSYAYIREGLGADLAVAMSPEELDAHIGTAQEMTADDLRRFIFERL